MKEWTEKDRRRSEKYPSKRKILNFIKKIEGVWRKEEKKILAELSKITGLKWKAKSINCYVVGGGHPFSTPLTMPIYPKYPNWFIDVLTHEMIHQLYTQKGNLKRAKKAWKYIYRKYRKEPERVKIHIPLHALHKHIFLKFFGEKRLKREINIMSHYPNYKKSWELVQEAGHENIIREFTKRIE